MGIKIGINAAFMHENPTGLGVYTHELLGELLKMDCGYEFVVYTSSGLFRRAHSRCPHSILPISPNTSPALKFRGHLQRFAWESAVLPLRAKKSGASLVYSTVPEGMLYPLMKQIITVHDILPARYPDIYTRMKYHFYWMLPVLLRNSSAIICPSESTKKDVLEYYGIKDKPVYVIYEGINGQRFYPREKGKIQKCYGFKDYLLYVGDMRPYKNLERALAAFATLDLKGVRFVICGKKDPRFYPGIEKKALELSLGDRVVFPGYVPEDDLPHLYSEALAFVFPSLHEGFGLPPLEAMACGCPVIASRAASVPEVCGEAACYADPHSVEDIAQGMHRVIADGGFRQNLIQKGLARARLFTWEKSAREHLKVFGDVLAR